MKKFFFLALISFMSAGAFAQSAPNSGTIMAAAYKQANKENKFVFVIFHASWCGWCKKMDAAMTDNEVIKKAFTDHFVIVHLDVQEREASKKNLENPGAEVFLAKYKGETAGLPFFLIMNKEGKKLGDSFVNGENLGCPASAKEVLAFVDLLRKTSTIDERELELIAARFRKNDN